jgi:hypothetical protein
MGPMKHNVESPFAGLVGGFLAAEGPLASGNCFSLMLCLGKQFGSWLHELST